MLPDAVGFDLGDTLIEYEGVQLDWQHRYPVALDEIAKACGRAPTEEQLATANAVLLGANTRVTPRAHELDHTEVFGSVLSAIGLSPEHALGQTGCTWPDLVERATDSFFTVFRRGLHAMPGAQALLDELVRRRVPVGVLTDVAYGMPRRLLLEDLEAAQLGRLAGVTLTSTEVRARKPAVDGFRLLSDRLGVPLERMWFVGNEYRDVAGAKAAGMTAVLLWRSADPAPGWGEDMVISSLDELRAVLASLERSPTAGVRPAPGRRLGRHSR